MVAASESESLALDQIYRSQSEQGLMLERVSAEDVHRRISGLSPETRGGVLVPNDHWVNNEQLMTALVEAGQKLGVRYLAHTCVRKLSLEGGRITAVRAGSDLGGPGTSYSAGCFILAAGCWSRELAALTGALAPVEPCRGQMTEFESPTELPLVVRAGHYYLVPRSPRRILAGTTAEYAGPEKAVTGAGLKSILEGVERFAPFVKDLKFCRAWAGLRPDTPDHLPILGRGEIQNLIFATGHFRNGILLAPITAQLISELVLSGSASRSLELYQPARFLPQC